MISAHKKIEENFAQNSLKICKILKFSSIIDVSYKAIGEKYGKKKNRKKISEKTYVLFIILCADFWCADFVVV